MWPGAPHWDLPLPCEGSSLFTQVRNVVGGPTLARRNCSYSLQAPCPAAKRPAWLGSGLTPARVATRLGLVSGPRGWQARCGSRWELLSLLEQ